MKQFNVMLGGRLWAAARKAAQMEHPRRTGWLTLWVTDVFREALRRRLEDPAWQARWKERYGVEFDESVLGEVVEPGAWRLEKEARKRGLADYGLKEGDVIAAWRAYNRGLPIRRIIMTLEKEGVKELTRKALIKLWEGLGLKMTEKEEAKLRDARRVALEQITDANPGMTKQQARDAALVAVSKFDIDLMGVIKGTEEEEQTQ